MNTAAQIIASLDNEPDAWTVGEYTADHKSGLEVWVANCWFDTEVYRPVKYSFSLRGAWLVRRAINRLKKQKIAALLKPVTATPTAPASAKEME